MRPGRRPFAREGDPATNVGPATPRLRPRLRSGTLPAPFFTNVFRTFLKAKIHRATLTAADPDYEGSITIDRAVCREAGLLEYEQVDVLDINNGARFTTYVIFGTKGEFQVNGAAARLVNVGDLVIVLAYCRLAEPEIAAHRARLVLMGPGNAIVTTKDQPIGKP